MNDHSFKEQPCGFNALGVLESHHVCLAHHAAHHHGVTTMTAGHGRGAPRFEPVVHLVDLWLLRSFNPSRELLNFRRNSLFAKNYFGHFQGPHMMGHHVRGEGNVSIVEWFGSVHPRERSCDTYSKNRNDPGNDCYTLFHCHPPSTFVGVSTRLENKSRRRSG